MLILPDTLRGPCPLCLDVLYGHSMLERPGSPSPPEVMKGKGLKYRYFLAMESVNGIRAPAVGI